MHGTKSVSQAAALALRQLQDQLSKAYAENARLQQEQSDAREDLQAQAQGHKAELQDSEAHAAELTHQVTEMRNMLEEMRDALETTADDNAKLAKEAERQSKAEKSVQQELDTCRSATLPATPTL